MQDETPGHGPILRLFQVRTQPGRAQELIKNFATTSADVVRNEPGNEGYFFGHGVPGDEDYVVFASVWRDMQAVKARFGDDWQTSYLPPGYKDMIEECSVRHLDLSAGWHVRLERED